MPSQITSFEGFIKHVLKLVFWVLLLLPLVILPLYYVVYTLLGINLLDVFSLIQYDK